MRVVKPLLFAALLLTAALLATPAAAVTIVPLPGSVTTTYDEWTRYVDLDAYNPGGAAIAQISIVSLPGTVTEFTLYDYGGTITGEINRTKTGASSEIVSYRLGDQIAGPYERSTWLPYTALPKETFTVQYGVYDDGSRHLWMTPGMKGGGWSCLGHNITNVIYRATVSATPDARVAIATAPWEDLNSAINQRVESSPVHLLALLWDSIEGVYLVVALGWYVFKKIFVENFYLFAGLFEIIGLAYAANKSRDFFQFLKRVVDYNVKAVKAMYWLIEQIITILTRIINALKPI